VEDDVTAVRVAHVATIDLTLRAMLLPQLRHLREAGFEVAGISAPGDSVSKLEAEGIRHIPWPHVTRAWDPKADLRAFRELLGILRRERFDIVHTHNPKPGIMGRVAARLAGAPCVVHTTHGLYATPAALSADGPDQLRREFGVPPNALVVGTVGRLVVEKGYREFFAAARRVSAANPDVWFLVVGPDDPDKWDALNARDMLAGGNRVVFTGWRDDVRDLLGLMDVFVLASWREGVPRSAIEAAAMGRALVLTDIRGCREVARHQVEGILVPTRDSVRLAEAIASLVGNPRMRQRLGAAARARAVGRFDERRVQEIVLAGYREVLSSKGHGVEFEERVGRLP
jgi:glycosyltransferase involved in cell wall biosynthesis